MSAIFRLNRWLAAFTLCVGATLTHAASPTTAIPTLVARSATVASGSQTASLVAVALAGQRIVAVGLHGVVLLSDDQGKSYRQAKAVPLAAALTSVHFVDDWHGWAVGHWGAILHTKDGGENWELQRNDLRRDQPLFTVYFKDRKHGWAAGLWSLLLVTQDGGVTWSEVTLPTAPGKSKADLNLFHIFPTTGEGLAITAEHGQILHSEDAGKHWRYIDTGYAGSLWSGTVLADGSWLAGGLRGSLLRSQDHGVHWLAISTVGKRSITGLISAGGNTVLAIGLDGMLLYSHDDGVNFHPSGRSDPRGINAAVVIGDHFLGFTDTGPLPPEQLP